jgi:hypothetical protein
MHNSAVRLPAMAGLLVLAWALPAAAQVSRGQVPSVEYWLARGTYFDGDFASARKQFQDAAKGAIISPEGRWVDSICYHTMIGECSREMGDLPQAVDQYSSALKMYLAWQNWMLRIEFPQGIDPATSLPPIPWGKPTRVTRIGRYRDKYPLIIETLTGVGDKGGVPTGLLRGGRGLLDAPGAGFRRDSRSRSRAGCRSDRPVAPRRVFLRADMPGSPRSGSARQAARTPPGCARSGPRRVFAPSAARSWVVVFSSVKISRVDS